MFRKSAPPAASSDVPVLTEQPQQPGGKGRPTPSRKEQEERNRRPLVPQDRRAAARVQRQRQKEVRDRQYAAMQSGDERFLPARDQGPQRRYVRDFVDARWSLGEFFLPVTLVFVVVMFLNQSAQYALAVIASLYFVVLITVVDAFILWRQLRKRLRARFGQDQIQRGTVMYTVMRAMQIRRARMPKPQVRHGQYPV